MAFDYTAYGLDIRSDSAIPFLRPARKGVGAHVSVELSPEDQILDQWEQLHWQLDSGDRAAESGTRIERCENHLKITFRRDHESALVFYISADTSHVLVRRMDGIPEIDAISFFIGPILGVICRLREKSCLHAAVLSYKGHAFALTGDKGAGKSTTSAMLLQCGAELVADDIAVIDHRDGHFQVQPAYPHMRVSADIMQLLALDADDAQAVLSVGEKRYLSASALGGGELSAHPVQLSAVYILSKRGPVHAEPRIEPLAPSDAIRRLNSNAYGTSVMRKSHRLADYALFAMFAREKHCRIIERPDDLSRLESLGQMILQDFGAIHV